MECPSTKKNTSALQGFTSFLGDILSPIIAWYRNLLGNYQLLSKYKLPWPVATMLFLIILLPYYLITWGDARNHFKRAFRPMPENRWYKKLLRWLISFLYAATVTYVLYGALTAFLSSIGVVGSLFPVILSLSIIALGMFNLFSSYNKISDWSENSLLNDLKSLFTSNSKKNIGENIGAIFGHILSFLAAALSTIAIIWILPVHWLLAPIAVLISAVNFLDFDAWLPNFYRNFIVNGRWLLGIGKKETLFSNQEESIVWSELGWFRYTSYVLAAALTVWATFAVIVSVGGLVGIIGGLVTLLVAYPGFLKACKITHFMINPIPTPPSPPLLLIQDTDAAHPVTEYSVVNPETTPHPEMPTRTLNIPKQFESASFQCNKEQAQVIIYTRSRASEEKHVQRVFWIPPAHCGASKIEELIPHPHSDATAAEQQKTPVI